MPAITPATAPPIAPPTAALLAPSSKKRSLQNESSLFASLLYEFPIFSFLKLNALINGKELR